MELPDISSDPRVRALVSEALAEDIGGGDATTLSLVPEHLSTRASIVARQACVISGAEVARAVFQAFDAALDCRTLLAEGAAAGEGTEIMAIEGRARSILTAERTALNFMQRMTGTATLTRRFVDLVKPYGSTILDTRKTTPGMRILEKYAVLCGGGANHRMGLFDRVLIKDNHRRLWGGGGGSLDAAIRRARQSFPDLPVEIEVENISELRSALDAGPDWVLLDNMPCDLMRECVKLCKGKCFVEASGGITTGNVADVASTGVDAISLGCLTHSPPSADLSLEIL